MTARISVPQETPTKNMNVTRDQLMAASIGNVDWLQLCMKATDSQVKADGYGFTALHMAATHSRLQCLKLLIEDYGMDVNMGSTYGWRALHLVMNQKSGHRTMQCLRYLLQQGADVNAKSKNLTSPLHRAASEGLEDCVTALLEAGADVHAKDAEGNKPIDLCHLWCRRSCARYLRSAMWKKDKKDYARELKKMEKVKHNIEETQRDASLQTEIPFCQTVPKSKPAHQCSYSNYGQGGTRTSSKSLEKEVIGKERTRNQKVILSERREEQGSDGRRSTNNFWNPSTNPHRSPSLHINRTPTLWQGIHPEDVTKKDISSRVFLTKDQKGQLQIQTLNGQVFSPPSLPYEVIERSLFPKRGPQDRIQMPKDFKPTHVFDVPKRQQPIKSQRPVSEISFHLRQNLGSKFRRSRKEPGPLRR
ncbi:ankyrin repeat domain-containing protein 53 isoform X2 [Rhinoderma darwinii]|uniref:ankyrin repeat domain-containing protein 53 isoform X2 n=1 Tax=Rhinoderma darwinii TaxID=43563 RepID=UPI003F674AD4